MLSTLVVENKFGHLSAGKVSEVFFPPREVEWHLSDWEL